MKRSLRLERVERFDELLVAFVVQARAAPDALALQDVTPSVRQHRPAQGPRLERDHREALEVRRHDQEVGRRQRVELVLVRYEAEMTDSMVRGYRHHRIADQEADPARAGRRARSAGSDRRARRIPCSRRCGRCRAQTAAARRMSAGIGRDRCRAGTSEPMPTTTPGTSELPATAWIIARSSDELYMIARTPRKIGPKIDSPTAGSRSAVGTRIALRGDAPHAVERVVVPIAEEEDVVEA